ncbi:hypothetical protein [Lutibacter citreus]|uniref:hypothetical protein n=1 Tax=Lutibacter citreus TaxID=2138210 RepID=UPI00130076DB|nr:hypothetical protein [Lutibacter citreus]
MKNKINNEVLKISGIKPSTIVNSSNEESNMHYLTEDSYPNDIQGLFNQLGI